MTSGFWDNYRKHPSDLLTRRGMFFGGFWFSRRTPRTSRSSGINETPGTMSQKWTIFFLLRWEKENKTEYFCSSPWLLRTLIPRATRFFFLLYLTICESDVQSIWGKKIFVQFPNQKIPGSWDAETSRECQHWSLKAVFLRFNRIIFLSIIL